MEKNRETSQYVMVHATTCQLATNREYSLSGVAKLNYGNTYDKKHSKAPRSKTEQIGHHTCILEAKISRRHYVTPIYK